VADVVKPILTDAARPATIEIPAINERGETVPTAIAGEHALTLYLDKRELVTLMTLGGAPEALVIGWLRNQRMLPSIDDIVSVQVDWEVNAAAITTRHGVTDLDARMATRTVTTGCGQGTGVRRSDGRHRENPPAGRRPPDRKRAVRDARRGTQT
jgi:FdhD protein